MKYDAQCLTHKELSKWFMVIKIVEHDFYFYDKWPARQYRKHVPQKTDFFVEDGG